MLISDRLQFVLLMVYRSLSSYSLTHPYYCLVTTCSRNLQVQCTHNLSLALACAEIRPAWIWRGIPVPSGEKQETPNQRGAYPHWKLGRKKKRKKSVRTTKLSTIHKAGTIEPGTAKWNLPPQQAIRYSKGGCASATSEGTAASPSATSASRRGLDVSCTAACTGVVRYATRQATPDRAGFLHCAHH